MLIIKFTFVGYEAFREELLFSTCDLELKEKQKEHIMQLSTL